MSSDLNGARLLTLRHLLGMTQEEMARDLDVSASFLSNVTKNQKRLPEQLAHLAALKYRVPMSFFSVHLGAQDRGPVTFKKMSHARKRDEERVVALYGEAARLFRHASTASGYHESLLPTVEEHGTDPETIAAAVRRAAALGPDAPIGNMTRLCETLGVAVIHQLDPDNADDSAHAGASRPTASSTRPLVALASSMLPVEKRFTIAHEIYHLIADQDLDVSPSKVRDPREQRANRFARALLLPESVAERQISESLTLHGYLRIKAEYGLGVGELIKRAEELRLVTQRRAKSLYIQRSSQGWMKSEPVPVADERPLLLHQALQRAHGTAYAMKVSHLIGVPANYVSLWVGPSEDNGVQSDNVVGIASRRRT